MCLYGSQNKQRLSPYTALTPWFDNRNGMCLLRGTNFTFICIFSLQRVNTYGHQNQLTTRTYNLSSFIVSSVILNDEVYEVTFEKSYLKYMSVSCLSQNHAEDWNWKNYTWYYNKVRELIAVKVLHTSLLNTIVVAFKVLPLGNYTPMPAPSPPFKTILELVLWNGLQSSLVLILMSSKCFPFNISFTFGNRKSHWGLDPVNRQGVPK